MKILSIRHGHATNSSSSHSIIVLPESAGFPRDELSSEGYGWNNFVLASREAKARYMVFQLASVMRRDTENALQKAWEYVAEYVDVPAPYNADLLDFDEWNSIDHQSVIELPLEYGTNKPCYDLFNELLGFVMQDDVVILGGNDNENGHPFISAYARQGIGLKTLRHEGVTVWLTGLSGAGKTTLAKAVADRLREMGRKVCILDGDEIRRGISRDLGFSPEDRAENVRRVGEIARIVSGMGDIAICALISPHREDRRSVRAAHRGQNYVEVHVDCPLEVCAARDPKRLYAQAQAGVVDNFTGVSAPYEAPLWPEARVDTSTMSVADCVETVINAMSDCYATPQGFGGAYTGGLFDDYSFGFSYGYHGDDARVFARKDPRGHWTLYQPSSGNKVRMTFDEKIGYDNAAYGDLPELVDMKITDRCNAGCPYCYMDSSGNGAHADLADVLRYLGRLWEAKVFEVALGGGEPTEHPEFKRILQAARELGVTPNFSTGSLTWMENPGIVGAIKRYCGAFAVSVDGSGNRPALDKVLLKAKQCGLEDYLRFQYVMGASPMDWFKSKLVRFVKKHNVPLTLLAPKLCGRGGEAGWHPFGGWLEVLESAGLHRFGVDTMLAATAEKELARYGVDRRLYETSEGSFSMYIDAVEGRANVSSFAAPEGSVPYDGTAPLGPVFRGLRRVGEDQ